MRLRVAIVDDQPIFRVATSHVLADMLHDGGVLQFHSADALYARKLRSERIDLVLLSINTPGTAGLHELGRIHRDMPELSSIVLPAHGHPGIADQAKSIGASGCLPKTSSESTLRSAVRMVMSGGEWFRREDRAFESKDTVLALQLAELTPKQMRVLELVAEGLSNRQIGAELGAAENTVKCHVVAILSKLECRSRTQAALLMMRRAWSMGSTQLTGPTSLTNGISAMSVGQR